MKMRKFILALFALPFFLISAFAQTVDNNGQYVQGYGGYYKKSDGSGPYSINSAGVATLLGSAASGSQTSGTSFGNNSGPAAYKNYSITTTSTQIVAAVSSRVFLDMSGQNSQVDIWCNFTYGQVAMVNPPTNGTNDSFRVGAGADARWENSFVPSDGISCIAASNTLLWLGAK